MPGAKGNGRACTRMVESLDIYRTMCELAGLEVPAGVEGTSLVPLLNDPRGANWNQPAYSIWSEDGATTHGTAVRTRHAAGQLQRVAGLGGRDRGGGIGGGLPDPLGQLRCGRVQGAAPVGQWRAAQDAK